MEGKCFQVTKNHLKLLRRFNIVWDDCSYLGAPRIYPKRPYGNSDILIDIAKIIGLRFAVDNNGRKCLNLRQIDICTNIHREMEIALQILTSNCHIEPGLYILSGYGNKWYKKSD